MTMEGKRTVLFIIDGQVSFTRRGEALFVEGSEEDTQRTAQFIIRNIDEIDLIVLTMDTHHLVDISHPSGWVDQFGKPIAPMTPISHQDILDGKYSWTLDQAWALEYTKQLEAKGKYQHFVWREHCIVGTEGHNIDPILLEAVHAWERKHGGISGAKYIQKGLNPLTEHFGAFSPQVSIPNEQDTQPNSSLLQELNTFDRTIICGQALSHCVGESISQIIDLAPELASKVTVLMDCASNVPNPAPGIDFTQNFPPIAERGAAMGMRFALSTTPID